MTITADRIRSVIDQYTEGWITADREKILNSLTPNCEIIESHGPLYVGTASIRAWIDNWHQAGGRVISWDITSFNSFEDGACYEWNFCCLWEEAKDSFSGCTIIKMEDDRIGFLREYRMTHPPYPVGPT